MKRALLVFFAVISCQITYGQSKAVLDNEKLLEFYQTQKYIDAAQYLKSIYAEDTQDEKEISQLAYANMMAGKLPEAEKNYLKLHDKQPQNLPVLFSLANINLRRGNDEKAKAYYMDILKIDSTNFTVYKQLANLNKGEMNLAKIGYLKKANEINPIDPDVVFDLCELYFKMNFFDKASNILQPALDADSTNLQLLKMKMPISMANKKYDEAIKTGEKLLSYGDSSTFVLNNLGKSYFFILDYKNALKNFLVIESKSMDSEALYYSIGLSYRGLKDYKNAIPYLEKAIQEGISTKIASYYGLLGDSFEGVNKNTEANAAYKKGLQFENNGSLLYNIALVYETKLNDKKNAIDYYEQYLKTINPKEQTKLIGFIKNKIVELKR
ncbi:tetratricopeptide repeat protein [Pedobacter panaciterrae]|uniref:Tetratricopeptide repeat protein n=1 Tax=Pedobacter panaciterrae TaxID=363849 RepID=A0ABU8NJ10_9SPHI|nr:tetratricopeptide repeat protein [uncultured Pedobacter sp.]